MAVDRCSRSVTHTDADGRGAQILQTTVAGHAGFLASMIRGLRLLSRPSCFHRVVSMGGVAWAW